MVCNDKIVYFSWINLIDKHFYLQAFSTAIALGYKTESSTVKDTIAVVSNIHIKTPAIPVYEIEFLSTAEIPRVNMLRNKVSDTQPVKTYLNKSPKQRSIQSFTIDAQGFRKTKNENPPTW